MRKWIIIAVAVLAAWTAWPLLTAASIRSGVLTADTAKLQKSVDWPGVRAGLKQSLPAYLAGNGVVARTLAVLLGNSVVDTVLDTYVSPQGVVDLMADPEMRKNLDLTNLRWAFFSGIPFAFEMVMRPPAYPDTRVINTFRMTGLGWQLASVRVTSAP